MLSTLCYTFSKQKNIENKKEFSLRIRANNKKNRSGIAEIKLKIFCSCSEKRKIKKN